MGKRAFDVAMGTALLLFVAPLILVLMTLIRMEDDQPALYRGIRVGRGNRDFRMLKLRTMRVGAEAMGGTSTANSDRRMTSMGAKLRKWKLDELPQLWNVVAGEMSLVGPRPNTRRGGVERYTDAELQLLAVRPGITDLASIVFADEGSILDGADDPDDLYDRTIRPWKSKLALLYVAHRSFALDFRILCLTALGLVSRSAALSGVVEILGRIGAGPELIDVCRRTGPLPATAPPATIKEQSRCEPIC